MRLALIAWLAGGLSTWLVAPAKAASVVSGNEVSVVDFAGGSFKQIGSGQWAEIDADGKVAATLAEVSRDEGRVVLEDAGRGITVILQLTDGVITFGAIGDEQQQQFHEILSTAGAAPAEADVAGDPVDPAPIEAAMVPQEGATSETATMVSFGTDGVVAGRFVRQDSGGWAELDAAGETAFRFEEDGRDAAGIRLVDASRGIALTLDVAGAVIRYGAIGDEQQPLYAILEARTEPAGDQGETAQASDGPIAPAAPGVEYRFVKLKHVGWYTGRFTVAWTETDDSGGQAPKTWASGEQEAPFFEVVEFPATATAITLVGEGLTDGEWSKSLDVALAGPSNKCYKISGTALTQQADESEDPSNTMDDDCP